MDEHAHPSPVGIRRPSLVGIVNITADSFSDGNRFLSPTAALAHAHRLHSEGADVIELGPAASSPGAEKVTAAEEVRRLADVIDQLVADGIAVSVDSYRPATQRFAAARGATYLNDIQGFDDPARYEELADTGCRLVVMHSVQRHGPATKVRTDPTVVCRGIDEFLADRLAALEAAGIGRDRLVIDPGLGYFLGSSPEPSLRTLAGLERLKARFDVPVLVSPSRKSFLRTLTGSDVSGIGPATLAAELYAARSGADYIRTHDVAALRDALTVFEALESAKESGW
ncbi:dihydropteroate synthase [Streptomyces phaeofaciens]|uniref:dihydropteroate synthase n=1 Tax=Streptomyces phaeofaciens TaxID=68254 RepID=A0A918HEF9_9ACTN|nr:dihydropteroate synthase [Streptomyces phaeofaciens]GGT51851.1 dihydropteroate synthase [Streptomyces phaeofaciens]